MPYIEVGFRLKHDCPLTRITQDYPTAALYWWCNHDVDVIEASYKGVAQPRKLRAALEAAVKEFGGRVVRRTPNGAGIQLVAKCTCLSTRGSVGWYLDKHNCLEIYPAVFTQGWEWYRMIALSAKDMKGLFSDLDRKCEVEVVSRKAVGDGSARDTLAISAAGLFSGLTEIQARALDAALAGGYYSVPKKTSTAALAASMGVTRTTFGEHLRKAESKVMKSLAPYMQFTTDRPHAGKAKGA